MTHEAIPGRGADKSCDPMPGVQPAATITIHVATGVILCTPQGGNVHVYRTRAAHAIRWRGDAPFKLEFSTFDDEAAPVWPFIQAEPDWPVREFTGTPKGGSAALYYKYSVSAGDLYIDPIVIVDK